jgi:PEGA domain
MVSDRGRRLKPALLTGLATVLLGLCGCVERRYTIRSDPPGALAVVNGEEIGVTPVSRSFTYYGDREVTLHLDGYQTQTIIQPINSVWWDNYFTEFFTENLIPYTFRDEREYLYQMAPLTKPDQNDLLARADTLRNQAAVLPSPRRGLREMFWSLFGYRDPDE